LSEHFPPRVVLPAAAGAAEQLAAMVRQWVAEKIRAGGTEPPTSLYPDLLRCVEPAVLEEVMRRVQGNRWVAAQWLGLNRATVRKKLGMYDLEGVARSAHAEGEDDGSA
jgi:Fis family transcriptional regulator